MFSPAISQVSQPTDELKPMSVPSPQHIRRRLTWILLIVVNNRVHIPDGPPVHSGRIHLRKVWSWWEHPELGLLAHHLACGAIRAVPDNIFEESIPSEELGQGLVHERIKQVN
eukprot:TRINITY_DN5234_c0_g1_i2.p1 TRINITY_DN5234_c0_g1~~TRINITY_DN5234_c0_g1_i2.p1  ORF type:complete len:113 (-),score=5.42 TRINITY_DN5234_c0_g1_i2:377-715(-)